MRAVTSRWCLGAAGLLLLAGCARRELIVEISGSVMHAKPGITEVSHTLTDERGQGGTVVVRITMRGDPGLSATFEISPDVASGAPMKETESGTYVGEFSFPPDALGGPFTVVGRLRHQVAGEVTFRDPHPISISLLPRSR